MKLQRITKFHKSIAFITKGCFALSDLNINLLKTKRNLLYIRHPSVPLCKHFPPRL